MPRVITAVSFDLKFNVLVTPPSVRVDFTDRALDGSETHGSVTITDDAAAAVFPAGLLDAVNAALSAKESALPDLPSLAARMTAADDAERRVKAATAALASVDSELTAKRAEVAAMAPAAATAEVVT